MSTLCKVKEGGLILIERELGAENGLPEIVDKFKSDFKI